MGFGNSTKYASLPQDTAARKQLDVLTQLDRMMTQVGLLLSPSCKSFGLNLWGRLNGMVRLAFKNYEEERKLRPGPLVDDDYGDGGKVCGHLNFLERRRLLMLFLVENSGGDLWLHSGLGTDGSAADDVKLEISSNRLVLVLAQQFSFSFRPRGTEHVTLQTWFISEPVLPNPEDQRVAELPVSQVGERVHVMNLHFRAPGWAYNLGAAWAMWVAGTDGCTKLPIARWDVDQYYNPNQVIGAVYCIHGACIEDNMLLGFDNKTFGIEEEEASYMGPGQRILLETGYEALYKEGYRMDTIPGLPMGIYVGDGGSDYQWIVPERIMEDLRARRPVNKHAKHGFQGGMAAARLSHLLGLRGPCISIDTACSSSLVAMGQAHRALVRRNDEVQAPPRLGCAIDKALVMGVALLDGWHTTLAYCAATMLSTMGRSFTFDESANGFVRGEGIGAIFVQLSDSDEDAQRMLAAVIGSNVNQDGRSASMTAPHGPSQQMCIRASMRQAGLQPSQITIAECHGTGTALGDPIEVGALRDVMKDRDEDPIIMTSGKTNFGHLEACAGLVGIARCVVMLNSVAGASNLHLRCLNPHIEYAGYPALLIDDLVDCGRQAGISGVSSFGIGGTNARGDLWGRALQGTRATREVCIASAFESRALLYSRIKKNRTPCATADDTVHISGSWDRWVSKPMRRVNEDEFEALITLGPNRRERFRLLLNDDSRQVFYPEKDADAQSIARSGVVPPQQKLMWQSRGEMDSAPDSGPVLGPDSRALARAWTIDGALDEAPAGTRYRVTFRWTFSLETGEMRRVSWERC